MLYSYILAIHVIAIICWMAGLLYLWRLFVYHRAETEQVVKDRFQIMEYRLYTYITMPSMLVSFILGVWMLALRPELLTFHWMQVKIAAVVGLIGVTHYAKRNMRQLKQNASPHTEKFFRILNELPTILMIIVVIMVIVRPF